MKKIFNRVLIGGFFVVFPLLIVIILISKAFDLLLPISRNLAAMLEIESIVGVTSITIITWVVFLLFCYLCSFLLDKGYLGKLSSKFEETMFLLAPGLQVLKYRLLDDLPSIKDHWKAVLLKVEYGYKVAFITNENDDQYISFYIPDAPRLDAGELVYLKKEECEYKMITMNQAMNSFVHFGREEGLFDFSEKKKKSLTKKKTKKSKSPV